MHVLSFSTWVVHVSSVLEWAIAIWLVWSYAESEPKYRPWRALAWGMLPALCSAFCAVTWHFFENAPALEWLVTIQAATTVLGNCTLCLAAWWIWRHARQATEN